MSETEDTPGVPDELIVIAYAGAMFGLVAVAVLVGFLFKLWMTQAEPNMRRPEPPAAVEAHH